MRFFVVLALAATVSAASLQRRQSFPTCSQSCLTNANFGSCDPLDDSCLCHDSGFVSSVTNCITSACSGTDLTNAEGAAQQLCLAVGVTLTATPTASGSGSGSSGSATKTGSAAGSATATSPSGSGSSSSAASSSTATTASGSNGAASHSVNALAALAAVGAVAFAL